MIRSTCIFQLDETPLIVLDRYPVDLDERLVESARRELTARTGATRGSEFSSGYLLGVEDQTPFPEASRLLDLLWRTVIQPNEEKYGLRFSFSFMKTHRGIARQAAEGVFFEGFHLDSHPGIAAPHELLRVLANLSAHPRRFRYALTDVYQIERNGIPVGRTEFRPLALPRSCPEAIVEIPGASTAHVHALKFWASVVPHVGLNDPHGSFLVSFESLADFSRLRILGQKPSSDSKTTVIVELDR